VGPKREVPDPLIPIYVPDVPHIDLPNPLTARRPPVTRNSMDLKLYIPARTIPKQ
jgi:hypothetical protein